MPKFYDSYKAVFDAIKAALVYVPAVPEITDATAAAPIAPAVVDTPPAPMPQPVASAPVETETASGTPRDNES